MPRIPFEGFCGPTYLAASPVVDASRSFNLYPEPGGDGSKTKMALIGRPGLSQTGYNLTLGSSPVRQLWAGNNRLFAVGGTHFYELSNTATVTTDYGAMSGSSGAWYAQVVANGTQLLVMDPTAAKIFSAEVTPAMTSRFNGVALEYLDGFYVAIATGASLAGSNPNQVNVSNLGDGTTWNALNYVIRTGAADLTNQLAVLNGQLWIFGQKSIEVWYNAGNPLFPFARIQGSTINLGCIAPASVVKFHNTIMWLGADDRGYPNVYMTKGMSPVRVSNFGIETLIGTVSNAAILPLAWAFGYQEQGHTFYVLTIVSQSYVPLSTYVYDLTTGLWHERGYGGSWPVCMASVPGFNSNGPNFVGDGTSGKVMFQGLSYTNDLGSAIGYSRTAPHVSKLNEFLKHSRLELDGDFGTATPTLDYSDDGGRTFGSRTRAMQQAASSARGTVSPSFRRFFATQLGRSRDRVYKVSITDSANLIRIANAYLDVNE